jgi:predicted outer membrane repeat protein
MVRISTLVKTLGAAVTILLLAMISVQAATLTVNTTADAGVGSLRQALQDAITNGAANDIVFAIPTSDPGYDLGTNRFTILLGSTLPTIPVSATNITNTQLEAITVRGDDTFRILELVNSAVVVITNITISHGSAVGNGGGVFMGDSGTLTLNDCTISDNAASFLGGGIYMNNSATLHVFRSTFASNTAVYGGAIFPNMSGTVNMNDSTLNGNSATDSGGAIYVEISSTLNATNNTFSGNSAGNDGGAIVNQATFTLTSNTITGNSASTGGGIYNQTPAATLNNNLVALNTAVIGVDLAGIPYTGTYNMIGNSDGSFGMNSPTNMWGTTGSELDPLIGPLQDNGGPTFTHALLFNSPALDQGNAPGLITDQRGSIRPFNNVILPNAGDGSDMGAFEFLIGPSAANVSISGRVVTGQGKGVSGISNASIVLSAPDGDSWTARSNSFGYFELTGIPADGTYLITVTHKRYTFEAQSLNVRDDVEGLIISSN